VYTRVYVYILHTYTPKIAVHKCTPFVFGHVLLQPNTQSIEVGILVRATVLVLF
jgi:hypothetical protein